MRKLLSIILCISMFACICGCSSKPDSSDAGSEASTSATESVMTNEELYNTIVSFAEMYSNAFTTYVTNKVGKVDTKIDNNAKTPAGKSCTAIFQCSEDKAFENLVLEIKDGNNLTYEEYDKFTDGSFFVTRSEYVNDKFQKSTEYWVADQKAFYVDREKKTTVETDISALGIYDNFEIIEQTYGK